jgi:sugar O-acyltransferase (sialic acid O-acetyltransferase NeuD family)
VSSRPYVVWGSRGHAKVISDIILARGGQVDVLIDNDPNAVSSLINVPLCIGMAGLDTWLVERGVGYSVDAAVAIGGARGQDRRDIGVQLRKIGLMLPQLIHASSSVSPSAKVGQGSHVLAGAVIAADATVGDFCIINHSASVDHECLIDDGVHIAPGAVLCGCVEIDENALIGAGSVILPRRHIGRNAQIGAGAVVTHDVPQGVIVAGNPAREIGRVS